MRKTMEGYSHVDSGTKQVSPFLPPHPRHTLEGSVNIDSSGPAALCQTSLERREVLGVRTRVSDIQQQGDYWLKIHIRNILRGGFRYLQSLFHPAS